MTQSIREVTAAHEEPISRIARSTPSLDRIPAYAGDGIRAEEPASVAKAAKTDFRSAKLATVTSLSLGSGAIAAQHSHSPTQNFRSSVHARRSKPSFSVERYVRHLAAAGDGRAHPAGERAQLNPGVCLNFSGAWRAVHSSI